MKPVMALSFALLLALPGCALTSKSEPLSVRYFTPKWEPARAAPEPANADGPRLRMGRISSSSHLRSRIVYRASDVEVAMYEDLRWTEKPEEYVRRALAQALFEERPLVQAVSGFGPALDVELLAFDEVHRRDGRAARVTLHYAVQDDRTVLDAQRVTVEVEVRGDPRDPENMAAAMGAALHEVAERLATRVASRLTGPGAEAGEAQVSAAGEAAGGAKASAEAPP